jgi:3-oxoadipate enol-lactonase
MKLHTDDGFLSYDRIGDGIPILFIHGYPLSRKIWDAQKNGLADIASVISIDLRGHGESDPFDPPYSMDLLAEDCKHLLDEEKITSQVVVCGLSMGGYVTLALFRKYPHIFKGVILTSTRSGADSAEGRASRDSSIKNVREHGVPFIADSMLPKLVSPQTPSTKPELMKDVRNIMLQSSVPGVIGALQGMRDRPDSTPLLAQIRFPVLIIHGVDDQLIPLSEAENVHQSISGSHLAAIPGAGHLPNMEQPDLYNQAVRQFLNSLT